LNLRELDPRLPAGRTPGLTGKAVLGALALLALLAALSGCDKPAATQARPKVANPLALVKVNDVEISMLQPDNELAAEARPAGTAKKMLEMLIDRQLLQEEALRNKLDREPLVAQALDRARTQILAQAYLQSKLAAIKAPPKAEVDAYFQAHPELFTDRKSFYMKELVVATRDFSPQLQARLDSAKSIEQVALWLDKHRVPYERAQLSRSTADLAPEMIARMQAMRRNQLFVIKAGAYSTLNALYDVKPTPVTAQAAAPQIELYLRNKKREEIGELELGRLRGLAKIEYADKKQVASGNAPAATLAGSPTMLPSENGWQDAGRPK
jgi:peptidyl-prolyl cis-trans isomerase C